MNTPHIRITLKWGDTPMPVWQRTVWTRGGARKLDDTRLVLGRPVTVREYEDWKHHYGNAVPNHRVAIGGGKP